jgi:hypothetical protein
MTVLCQPTYELSTYPRAFRTLKVSILDEAYARASPPSFGTGAELPFPSSVGQQ